MSEGQKQRDGGFSGGLAAAWWFGGFVFEIDVLLGNSSSCPNSRSESCPGTSSFVSDTGVFCAYFFSVISADWFLFRHMCKHGYQRGKKKKTVADVCVVYV